MENVVAETFYGVTLSEAEPLAQFQLDPDSLADHKLTIKTISLGIDAKEGEYNVVEASYTPEIESIANDKDISKIPIAVLKVGETRTLKPNIDFTNVSVIFKLIQGTGPVHILGQHGYNEVSEEEWANEYDEAEYEYEDDAPQTNGKTALKKE